VLGMWMIGGGPNPHFALVLGGILERVDQPRLAWQAYQRAQTMADGIWPDPKIREGFVAHCKTRQSSIEQSVPGSNAEVWTRQFDQELAQGRKYQEAYHAYEVARIADGVPLEERTFYDKFYAQNGRIASPVGEQDSVVVPPDGDPGLISKLPAMLLFGGIAAVIGLLVALQSRPTTDEPRTEANSSGRSDVRS